MREHYFDLRNGDLKVLVKEEKSIVYTVFVENFFSDKEKIKNVFKEIKESLGYNPSGINLILPDEEFIVKEMLLPKISDEEINKLTRKRLESDLGTKEFSYFYKFLREEENGRFYIIQAIKSERVQYYEKFFKDYKIKIDRITSGLVLNIKIAEELSVKDNKPKIIVEIERNAIDVFAVIESNILKYQHFNLPKIDFSERENGEVSKERLIKKQIYLITDYIYNFNLGLTQEFVDLTTDSFIIYGTALKIYDGIDTALKDALPQRVELLAEKLKIKEDYSVYVSLYCYSELGKEKVFNFLIKKDYREIFSDFLKSKIVIFLLVLISLGIVLLLEYLNISYKKQFGIKKVELEIDIKKLKSLEDEKEIDNRVRGSRINIYYIFKELANKLPKDTYLERLVFTRNEVQKKNILELTYNISLEKDSSKNKNLIHIKEVFGNIPWVKVIGEPSVSSKIEGKKDLLVIKINYELENHVK